jgi:ABC-type branched-subunit amino acid transport system substrate-binding protein
VGLVVPLSGKGRLVGERALRGALLGAHVVQSVQAVPAGEAPAASPIALVVADSGARPDGAAVAVDELARAGVAAVVLSPDRAEALTAAAARAASLGLPVLDLSPDETAAAARFHLLRPNAARAIRLAEHALAAGAKRIAVLHPDSAYGRKMADAFVGAAQAGGAVLVARLGFDEKATTFIAPAKKLAELAPDAVFVPSAAGQLELIAAQLAASGVTRGASRRAGATLYATADGAGARLLGNAGRYLQGAVLAPVFFPGGDAAQGERVERYRAAFGEEPSSADALAADAVACAADAIARLPPGAMDADSGRRIVQQTIAASPPASGFTGALAFAPDGRRAGAPPLIAVDGERVKVVP